MSTALSAVRPWLLRTLLTIVGLIAGWLFVAEREQGTRGTGSARPFQSVFRILHPHRAAPIPRT